MLFEFSTAGRIVFGRGVLARLGTLAQELGSRAFVVTGKTPRGIERATEKLAEAKLQTTRWSLTGEPTVEDARRGAEAARQGSRAAGISSTCRPFHTGERRSEG